MLLRSLRPLAASLLGLGSLLPAGCAEPPSGSECAALLDRYVSLLAAADRPSITEQEVVRLRAEARAIAAQGRSFRECPSRVSRKQLACALEAPNPDRFEQCLL